jgi:hypothetical protein
MPGGSLGKWIAKTEMADFPSLDIPTLVRIVIYSNHRVFHDLIADMAT